MDLLHEGLVQLGFADEALKQLEAMLNTYIDELLLFNKRRRMVNTDDRDEIVVRHVLDCLAACRSSRSSSDFCSPNLCFLGQKLYRDAPCLPNTAAPVIADVGSGAGLPGIPLACAMPNCRFTLIERMAGRSAFLENVAAVLRLDNVEIWQCDAAKPQKAHFADIVTSRAYAPLDQKSVDIYRTIARPGGMVALYKTPQEGETAQSDAIHLGSDYRIIPLAVPFMADRQRCIISFRLD